MPPLNPNNAEGQWKGNPVRFRRDRLLVSVRPGFPIPVTLNAVRTVIEADLGAMPGMIHPPGRPWAIFTFLPQPQAEARIPALAALLAQRPDLRYAEPDFEGTGHLEPTDDEFVNQRAWTDVVGMEAAWDKTQGSSDVLIAVLDSGISISSGKTEPDHVEFSDPRFIVQHALSGTDVKHDYVSGDTTPADGHGHGTHVAGIICAKANNTDGIAGINWVSKVYIARVLDEYNTCSPSNLKLAMNDLIAFAADQGYTRVVVNLSLGVQDEADSMKQMCEESNTGAFLLCIGPGTLFTAKVLDYPGAFAVDFDHVISVGCLDGDDIRSLYLDDYSTLTLFAPGVDIVSVAPDYKVTLWDPATAGFDAYPTLSGPSQAAAIVSGIASLMWSANLGLTPAQIKECLLHTAEVFVDPDYTGARVHAGNAIKNAAWALTLDTPHLTFVDVMEGETRAQSLTFTVASCTTLSFEVVTGSDAGLPASCAITVRTALYDPDVDGSTKTGIEVEYTGPAPGDVAYGEFKVHCVESGEEWSVYLTANTISPVRSAVVLVADKSGSMAEASGVGTLSRMDVLHYSAEILVDTMRVGDGLGIVSFEGDASPVSALTNIENESLTSAERTGLKTAIGALAPGGSTSIGDGVVLGNTTVTPAAQNNKALLVLTDGHENTVEMIADVMSSITIPVYAIGMGTAAVIQPASLAALTTVSGGYVVLTDTMDDSTRYKVAKYLVQMVAAVSGTSLVLDPGGFLRPGITLEIPFSICREDRTFTALFMMDGSALASFELVTPDGVHIRSADVNRFVRFAAGKRSSRFRVSLPLTVEHEREHQGTWRAVLSISQESYERNLVALEGRTRPGPHGFPYEFVVLAESDLRVSNRVQSHGNAPGSTVAISTVLTSRSQGLNGATVEAHVRWPDGTERSLTLRPLGRGAYEESFAASQVGVYECRIVARGSGSRADAFTREETLTAHIWQESAVTPADLSRSREIDSSRRME